MSSDVAIDLIKDVNTAFRNNCIRDKKIGKLTEKLKDGSATYKDAYSYATSIGNARAKAFKSQVTSNRLPDGKMYYNIASRLLENTLGEDYNLVAEYTQAVQELLNAENGISLKALKADKTKDRIKGFIDRISSEDNYDDIAWILDEPVRVHDLSVVDDTVKKNSEFQSRAGIGVKVIRIAEPHCCEWCSDLEGEYTYPGVPGEVFARHDNCRCIVIYDGHKLSAYESKNGANTFRVSNQSQGADTENKPIERSRPIKYGEDAINVNMKYIESDTYKEKFRGLSNSEEIDDKIYNHAKEILSDRSGTQNETLVLLNRKTGDEIVTIKTDSDANRIKYSDADLKKINEARENGADIFAIHNHPTGYPPTADDASTAFDRGYSEGITCGHNGNVWIYKPSPELYDKDSCDEIHRIIADDCKYETNIDKVLKIWKNDLEVFGIKVHERR